MKSTKQTDRLKAETIALEYEHAAKIARQGVLTEQQCRKVLDDMLNKTTGERFRGVTAEEFLRSWHKGKELAQSAGTATRYENTINLFIASLGSKATRNVVTVTARDVERFRDQQLKLKAASTVNVDLKTLRTAFNAAMRQGLIDTNPVNAIEFPKEQRHERGVFTVEQLQAILGKAQGEWKTAIMFGFYLGARLGDAVSMNWSHVDFEKKTVNYTQEKTGKFVTCPMHPELEAHLLTLSVSDRDPAAPLMPTLAEVRVGGRRGLSAQFARIMKAAGVDGGTIEGTGENGRAFSKLSFHSLRHSFNSLLANADVTQEIRMKLTGHSTEAANNIYTKVQLDPLKAAITKLPFLTP